MNWGKVFPAFGDDELDHDVARWLSDTDRLALSCSSIGRDLSRLSDSLEPIPIRSLATFDWDLLDARRDKSNLIDNLSLLELNSDLLWEHAGR